MARLLMRALQATGTQVVLASTLRSWDGGGDRARQQRIRSIGERIAQRLVKRYAAEHSRPGAWFTYHLYYKAPDWLGPRVTAALDIPYIVAEASVSPKQAAGAWQEGHEAVLQALRSASAVISLNPRDLGCLRPVLEERTRLYELRPFLDTEQPAHGLQRPRLRRDTAGWLGLDTDVPWLLAVAMLRRGDKLASFEVLAAAMRRLGTRRWQLVIAGDGPARTEVQSLFARFGSRVVLAGAQPQDVMEKLYGACDLLVWPAVNEAYGMALLEAQTAGLPVVAGRREGVAEIVCDGETGLLTPEGDDQAFAQALWSLLDDPGRREAMAKRASRRAATERRFDQAVSVLRQMLHELRDAGAYG